MAQDLVQLSERVYYLPGAVNMAFAVGPDHEAVLVDTGGDRDAGRRLKRACETLAVKPVAVLNTHAHADHYGGNEFLVRNLNLPVYAPPFEASIMASPYLEPVYLFNGAKPPPELLSKWLLAKASPVDHVLTPGHLELAGLTLEVLDTSGHAHTHYAVLVDGVLLAADAVFGLNALARYPIPFGQDVGRQMISADRVAGFGAQVVLPGHGDPVEGESIQTLVEANLAVFSRAAEAVAAACTGVNTAGVLRGACDLLGVELTDLPRYYLNLCVVSAYLSSLRETGRVRLELAQNDLRWWAN